MAAMTPYIACLIGAIGLYMVLRPSRRALKVAGGLIGLAAIAWIAVNLAAESEQRPGIFFWIFSLISIASAVRMISHPRPVYSALFFVMVVLSSAGLFLLLGAEFMAFALVIVYAGAILITYLFVLMLAHQASDENHSSEQATYDAVAREPAAAVLAGFVMLALLTHMIRDGSDDLIVASQTSVLDQAADELAAMPRQLEETVLRLEPEAIVPEGGFEIGRSSDGLVVLADVDGERKTLVIPESAYPRNVQSVGLSLVADFPASLELAGIILLMAMFGAVVLARRQIEISEDETREAAGLERFDFARDDRVEGEAASEDDTAGGDA